MKIPALRLRWITRILNIAPHEWPKVSLCFGLEFFFNLGHVIGHTVIIAMFAQRIGIENLPYLFIADAALMMAGTTFFSQLIERFKKEGLLIFLSIAGSAILLLARSMDLASLAFYALVLVASSVLFSQMHIIMALFSEDQFTPVESHRTLPVIHSAPLLASLAGGILVTALLGAHVHTPDLLYVWAGSVFLVSVLLVIYKLTSEKIPYLKLKIRKTKLNLLSGIKESTDAIKKNTFLKNMAIVVLVQLAIAKLLEFQYTKALNSIAEHAPHSEDALTHNLSVYIIVFSIVGILLQFLFAGRIVRSLGIVRSMMLNPILSIVGYGAMAYSFGPVSAVSARFVSDATVLIFKNAYASSYYAVHHKVRERVKALIEGWMYPIGIIAGTLLLIGYQQFVHGAELNLLINVTLMILALLALLKLLRLRGHYTDLSIIGLNSTDRTSKHSAIEILGEHGHEKGVHSLLQALSHKNEPPAVKVKILQTFGRLQDESTVPAILDALESEYLDVKLAAVEALGEFKNLGQKFFTQAFTKFRISTTLQHLFIKETSKTLKTAIVHVFAHIHDSDVIPFLLNVLQAPAVHEGDSELQAECIHVIGRFHDANIGHYLRPFLASPYPKVRAAAIIALWQFPLYRLELVVQLVQMMAKKEQDYLLATLYLLGELRSVQEIRFIESFLTHDDPEVRLQAGIALAKLDHHHATDALVPMILDGSEELSKKATKMLHRIETSVAKLAFRMVDQDVSRRIRELFTAKGSDEDRLEIADLQELKRLYGIVGMDPVVYRLEEILKLRMHG